MTEGGLRIDPVRLLATLEASAAIGAIEETGLCRLALSDEDRAMRDLFVRWARDDGFCVSVDGVGNIFVRADGADPLAAPVVIGSHLDTQVLGGRYDGVLGVLAGLEVLRTLRDNGITTRRPIEVVSWTDEEGARFSMSMMGSSVFAGLFDLGSVLAAGDRHGLLFGDELRRIGYAGDAPIGGRALDAYYELHIEQGPTMDEDGTDVGIVDGSYSVRGMNVEVRGETSHIGPTPMDRRRNALVGAGYLIAAVNDIGLRWHAEDAKTTVSRLDCEPNRYGIVPHRASLTIDYRHADPARADLIAAEIDAAIRDAAERARVEIAVIERWRFGDEPFDADLVDGLLRAAEAVGRPYRRIRSQAGHDAYSIAHVAPTAMVFTPCVGGITHNTRERIEPERTWPAVDVLLNAVRERADRP